MTITSPTIDITNVSKMPELKAKTPKKAKKDVDILHDTPLRYTGYCDDIGAAAAVLCRNSKNAFVKALPVISFVPVGGYIAADVATTYSKSKKSGDDTKLAAKKATSQLIFQGLTSLLFPVAVVAGSQKIAGKVMDKFVPSLKKGAQGSLGKRSAALAVAGVAGLLLASKAIDKLTQKVIMKKVVNPILGLDKEQHVGNSGNTRLSGDISHSKLGTTQA